MKFLYYCFYEIYNLIFFKAVIHVAVENGSYEIIQYLLMNDNLDINILDVLNIMFL